jgi:hypothetical protein
MLIGDDYAKRSTESSRSICLTASGLDIFLFLEHQENTGRVLLQSRCSHEDPYVLAPASPVTICNYMFPMLSIAGSRVVSAQDARARTPAETRRIVPFPSFAASEHLEPREAFANNVRSGFFYALFYVGKRLSGETKASFTSCCVNAICMRLG